MKVQEMINELIHYVQFDLDNYTDKQIIRMFNSLFGGMEDETI